MPDTLFCPGGAIGTGRQSHVGSPGNEKKYREKKRLLKKDKEKKEM